MAMKRTAGEAFGTAGAAPAVFAPQGQAMFDPKAYFNQYLQQSATNGQAAAAAAAANGAASSAAETEKTEIQKQVEAASAIRCAAIVKEKGHNFPTPVAIEALCTMATKSSYKLREELMRQGHVKALCKRIRELLSKPPPGFDINTMARAAEALSKFPEEARGDAAATFGAAAASLGSLKGSQWTANSAAKLLHALAKGGEAVVVHKDVVTKVLSELVREGGRRIPELSDECLTNLMFAVARSRRHTYNKLQMNRREICDESFFEYASKRIIATVDTFDVRLLAEIVNTHNEIGLKDEPLFKAICPRIVKESKDLSPEVMSKCIKAYCKFMIPLKEDAQGFRTMAIVQKGDFIRPSDKPKKMGKKTYDKPVALYPKPQLQGSG